MEKVFGPEAGDFLTFLMFFVGSLSALTWVGYQVCLNIKGDRE